MNPNQLFHCAIPNHTIENMMGEDRWNKILNEIKDEYGTKRILIEYTDKGPRLRLKTPTGKLLGAIARVERWATKRRKQRRK